MALKTTWGTRAITGHAQGCKKEENDQKGQSFIDQCLVSFYRMKKIGGIVCDRGGGGEVAT
jgi:hypothetical protein